MSRIVIRPKIVMDISIWEIILAGIHLVLFFVLIQYFTKEWQNIPKVIPGLSYRAGEKTYFFIGVVLGHFLVFGSAIYTILSLPRNNYFKGKSVSSKPRKAKVQYRVEASLWLCLTIAIHVLSVANNIIYVETQIKKNHISIDWAAQFLIVTGVIWLIHHILWTMLSDK
jgi:hypothetical protein